MAKVVCGHIYVDCILEEQKTLSNNGEKNIGKYCAALTNIFEALGEVETKQCEDIAGKWNTNDLPDDIQQKCISCNSCTDLLILHTHTDCPKIFQRMSLTFWSTWSIGLALSSLHLWPILMQMVNKHIQGIQQLYICVYRFHMFTDMRPMG